MTARVWDLRRLGSMHRSPSSLLACVETTTNFQKNKDKSGIPIFTLEGDLRGKKQQT